ncbi:class C sortase [Jeotgalibaca sp. MA1X17-3]|uniref:class C sortase n=1 Tax=Jeotgalibaca sp. MA1X17-3 TaxID=2908211 RepID=UPI001F40AF0A|nr:class C sortase [Jeotgalibaca sp. MA1X17-3]UJF16298.1 class C sortase [Jeotgalibaca sp. MA1X17-3]
MKTKKIVGILLFLIGFGLILYPMISRAYYDIYSRQEIKQINENIGNGERSESLYNQQLAYNQSEISNPENIEVPEVTFIEEPVTSSTDDHTANNANTASNNPNFLVDESVLGTISIPKIDIVYPIYDGATHENLLNGVARIEGTSYPVGGMDTNSVIAGHNGLVGKTYFSFIKDMDSGDIIEIKNRKELLTYEVYKTAVIEPDDSAALAVIPGQDTLTLLTCTWLAPGTHRYLVFARRIRMVLVLRRLEIQVIKQMLKNPYWEIPKL